MTDLSAYCRQVEAYLCQRNGGHLIRVVGPAFELVRGWAEAGIPLTVVRDGIDRTVARAARRASIRRRPVPVEFCQADVLDAFDRWRRAVGVAVPASESHAAQRGTLAAHLELVSRQLTAQLVSERPGVALRQAIESALDAITTIGANAAKVRGSAREALIARLSALDDALVTAAQAEIPAEQWRAICARAESELAPFRDRLEPAAWTKAVGAAQVRALRLALGLPTVAFE